MKIITVRRRPLRTFPATGFIHAHSDGSPVLIEHSSWRTVCGMFVNTKRFHVLLQWRRWG